MKVIMVIAIKRKMLQLHIAATISDDGNLARSTGAAMTPGMPRAPVSPVSVANFGRNFDASEKFDDDAFYLNTFAVSNVSAAIFEAL